MDSFFSTTPLSQAQLNIFHKVDRQLYCRLVFDLNRDPVQSSQVMALWLWLEKALQSQTRSGSLDLITKSLLPLSDVFLNNFANESVLVLNCVEKESFPFSSSNTASSSSSSTTTRNFTALRPAPPIPMFRVLIKDNASLELFYGIRLRVISGVAEMANKVCARVFKDIMKAATEIKAAENNALSEAFSAEGRWNVNNPMMIMMPPLYSAMALSSLPFDGVSPLQQSYNLRATAPRQQVGFSPLRPSTSTYNVGAAPGHGGDELSEIMIDLSLNDQEEEGVTDDDHVVPPDERTIFLTFSKGYPIPGNEVKSFFERYYSINITIITKNSLSISENGKQRKENCCLI